MPREEFEYLRRGGVLYKAGELLQALTCKF